MTSAYSIATQNFSTILDFLRFGFSKANQQDLYYGHGTDNAWDDMLALIAGVLALPFDFSEHLLNAKLTDEEKEILCIKIHQRVIDKTPVPYLTNKAYFCDLPFYVDDRVLIPRSPIAELIKNQFSPWIDASQVHRILDMCTGSACIAIACHYAFPEANILGVDVSSDALAVAQLNIQRHQVEQDVKLVQSDCFESVPTTQMFDVIIANPPYVSSDEMKSLPGEYEHEPVLALEASNNGLQVVEDILKNAAQFLSPHGILIMEVGNSEVTLMEAYPHIPFMWLDFENGGQGVFLITYDDLVKYFND